MIRREMIWVLGIVAAGLPAAAVYAGAASSTADGKSASQAASAVSQPVQLAQAGSSEEQDRGDDSEWKEPSADDLKKIAKLPEADQRLAKSQRLCPVSGEPLGSMGVPPKIVLKNQPVFLCCKGCIDGAKENPDETLKKVAELKKAKKPKQ